MAEETIKLEAAGTDSYSDLLSSSTDVDSSESSLTSLTSDVLQLTSTEESETIKLTCKSDSDITTDACTSTGTNTSTSCNHSNTSTDSQLPSMNTRDWYLHPLFQRYWKLYAQSMAWCQSHRAVAQNLLRNGHTCNSQQSKPYSCHNTRKKKNRNLKTSKQPMFKMPMAKCIESEPKKTKQEVNSSATTCDDTALSDADSEVYEMEITEDMVDFFAKTEKHRKERDEEKKTSDGRNDSIVDIGQASKKVPTIEAPKERPGVRRTSEMTQLYGKGAAMIHGMETALQMTYDRNVDIKQPPCWPNMPLKIMFK